MIELSPKRQFQVLHKEHMEKFSDLVAQPAMKTALTHAFAQLATSPVTTEELGGAKKFLVIFASMSEPDATPQPLPAKTLSQ